MPISCRIIYEEQKWKKRNKNTRMRLSEDITAYINNNELNPTIKYQDVWVIPWKSTDFENTLRGAPPH